MNAKKGRGRALMLDTGAGTHLTLVYFLDLPEVMIPYIKDQIIQWFQETYQEDLELELTYGEMWGKRSIKVTGPIIEVQNQLRTYLSQQGYPVDVSSQAMTPHVDLRGKDVSCLAKVVNLINDLKL